MIFFSTCMVFSTSFCSLARAVVFTGVSWCSTLQICFCVVNFGDRFVINLDFLLNLWDFVLGLARFVLRRFGAQRRLLVFVRFMCVMGQRRGNCTHSYRFFSGEGMSEILNLDLLSI